MKSDLLDSRIFLFVSAVVVSGLLFAPASGFGQGRGEAAVNISKIKSQSKPVTLTQAIQVALANNTDIKRSLLSVKNADEQVKIAWGEVLPDISGSASYTRNLEIPVNFVPAKFFDPTAPPDELVPLQFGTDNNWQGGVSVNQTLFRGEAFVGISSSRLFKEVQAENMRATTQQIVTETRIAYYNVLVAEEQMKLQQATVDRIRENLRENRARQEAGLIDEFAVMQVEVQLSNQQPELIEARYAVDQAYRELKLSMGLPLGMSISVQGNLGSFNITQSEAEQDINKHIKEVDKMTPYSFQKSEGSLGVAGDLRGDIRVLEKRVDLKEQEIKAIKSRFLPTLSAAFNLNWSAAQAGSPVFFGSEDTRARSQTVGLTLSLPLFQGFERSANLQMARIEKKDLRLQRELALRSANNEIASAEESLNQAIETAPARRRALQQAREGYERAQARFENGIGSQLDLTEAEFQLRQAEVNYARMVFNYLAAKARYDQAVGMVPFVDKSNTDIN